ncbi:MAG: hypothetical protein H0V66_04980 [Bdellovibrionales bacterium]|nr:hypothetical protein [Bdellovibrionales bacterium]
MNKLFLIGLSFLMLNQLALAEKAVIYKNNPDQRVYGGAQAASARRANTNSINLHNQRVKELQGLKNLSADQNAERDSLIKKYLTLAKEMNFKEARSVAEVLQQKYDYKVDLSLIENKLSEEDNAIIAKAQEKFDYYSKMGDKESAYKIDSDIYGRYNVHLVQKASKAEAIKTETSRVEATRMKTVQSKSDLEN